jgi:nucleoside-diphosphate-sugar epimerase
MNELDAQSVMETFVGIAQRVVAISSQDVYCAYGKFIGLESGPAESVPITEDAPLRQRLYPYRRESLRSPDDPTRYLDDYDKIPVEQTIMGDPDLPGTILRLPMVYGPRDNQHRLFEYLKRMDDQRPAILLDRGLARWRWTRGYVENVAAAIALAVTDARAAGRIYNVGEQEALTTSEWVRKIGDAVRWSGQVIPVRKEQLPDHLVSGINTDQHLVTDSSRIREELGYEETVSHDAALERTIDWEGAHFPEEVDPTQFDYAAEDALVAKLSG